MCATPTFKVKLPLYKQKSFLEQHPNGLVILQTDSGIKILTHNKPLDQGGILLAYLY